MPELQRAGIAGLDTFAFAPGTRHATGLARSRRLASCRHSDLVRAQTIPGTASGSGCDRTFVLQTWERLKYRRPSRKTSARVRVRLPGPRDEKARPQNQR